VTLQEEVYHIRFLFAIGKWTGATGNGGSGWVATAAQNGRQGGAKSSAQVAERVTHPKEGAGSR